MISAIIISTNNVYQRIQLERERYPKPERKQIHRMIESLHDQVSKDINDGKIYNIKDQETDEYAYPPMISPDPLSSLFDDDPDWNLEINENYNHDTCWLIE